jgi:hypothetical protein
VTTAYSRSSLIDSVAFSSADKSDESHVVTLTDAWVIPRRLVGVFRQPEATKQSADGFLKYKECRTTHS